MKAEIFGSTPNVGKDLYSKSCDYVNKNKTYDFC